MFFHSFDFGMPAIFTYGNESMIDKYDLLYVDFSNGNNCDNFMIKLHRWSL